MHYTADSQRSMLSTFTVAKALALWGVCLGAGLSGCAEENPSVRPTPVRSRPAKPAAVDTPTVENADDRAEGIRHVCNRKASTELSRCWSEEFDRTRNNKFSAQINVMLTVSPSGQAQEVEVLNPQPSRKELEQCVTESAKSWTFPSGQTVAPVQCSFFLQSSQ